MSLVNPLVLRGFNAKPAGLAAVRGLRGNIVPRGGMGWSTHPVLDATAALHGMRDHQGVGISLGGLSSLEDLGTSSAAKLSLLLGAQGKGFVPQRGLFQPVSPDFIQAISGRSSGLQEARVEAEGGLALTGASNGNAPVMLAASGDGSGAAPSGAPGTIATVGAKVLFGGMSFDEIVEMGIHQARYSKVLRLIVSPLFVGGFVTLFLDILDWGKPATAIMACMGISLTIVVGVGSVLSLLRQPSIRYPLNLRSGRSLGEDEDIYRGLRTVGLGSAGDFVFRGMKTDARSMSVAAWYYAILETAKRLISSEDADTMGERVEAFYHVLRLGKLDFVDFIKRGDELIPRHVKLNLMRELDPKRFVSLGNGNRASLGYAKMLYVLQQKRIPIGVDEVQSIELGEWVKDPGILRENKSLLLWMVDNGHKGAETIVKKRALEEDLATLISCY